MKKILAFALCVLLVLAMLPVASFAASKDDDYDDIYEADGIEVSGTNVYVGRLSKNSTKYKDLRDFAGELGATLNSILFSFEVTKTESGDKEIMFSFGEDYEEEELTILYRHKDGTIDVILAMCDETGDLELKTTADAAYLVLDGPEYAEDFDSGLKVKKPGTYVSSSKEATESTTSSTPITVKPETGATGSTGTSTGTSTGVKEENPNTGFGTLPRFLLWIF
ncbi:MAG TPA: hypothetical protein PLP20_03405 [Oscillospiraceae bacterium]|nr:hypothetical protein [Oscillospiraceae bacterium]HNW04648.1 hypothetical protein [Oscillospiraceae bacterium]HPW00086.1 hypothetical protein [Oscillospiraceae bacterium]